ncbi:histone H2B type 2-E-like [Chironomus tepperi]|uniref:histone H2B type 2-E-like n=1 Tax=Chironomus tepperi TaxID=113505 RepID=UPI00391F00C5
MARLKNTSQSRRSSTLIQNKTIKKTKPKSNVSFRRYIYNVLKQVYPDLEITQQSIKIMNSFVQDTFERLANEAGTLVRLDKRKTMTEWDIQSAVRLVLKGGDLTKHAVHEGTKAVVKINVGQGLNATRDDSMHF